MPSVPMAHAADPFVSEDRSQATEPFRQRLSVLGQLFDVLLILLSLADPTTDVLVGLQLYHDGKHGWAYVIWGIAVVSTVACAAITSWALKEKWAVPSSIKGIPPIFTFAFFLPIGQLTPTINYFAQRAVTEVVPANDPFIDVSVSLVVREEQQATERSTLATNLVRQAVARHESTHSVLLVQTLAGSIPQTVVQLLVMGIVGNPTPLQHASLLLAIANIVTKLYVTCDGCTFQLFMFRFACVTHDVLTILYVILAVLQSCSRATDSEPVEVWDGTDRYVTLPTYGWLMHLFGVVGSLMLCMVIVVIQVVYYRRCIGVAVSFSIVVQFILSLPLMVLSIVGLQFMRLLGKIIIELGHDPLADAVCFAFVSSAEEQGDPASTEDNKKSEVPAPSPPTDPEITPQSPLVQSPLADADAYETPPAWRSYLWPNERRSRVAHLHVAVYRRLIETRDTRFSHLGPLPVGANDDRRHFILNFTARLQLILERGPGLRWLLEKMETSSDGEMSRQASSISFGTGMRERSDSMESDESPERPDDPLLIPDAAHYRGLEGYSVEPMSTRDLLLHPLNREIVEQVEAHREALNAAVDAGEVTMTDRDTRMRALIVNMIYDYSRLRQLYDECYPSLLRDYRCIIPGNWFQVPIAYRWALVVWFLSGLVTLAFPFVDVPMNPTTRNATQITLFVAVFITTVLVAVLYPHFRRFCRYRFECGPIVVHLTLEAKLPPGTAATTTRPTALESMRKLLEEYHHPATFAVLHGSIPTQLVPPDVSGVVAEFLTRGDVDLWRNDIASCTRWRSRAVERFGSFSVEEFQ